MFSRENSLGISLVFVRQISNVTVVPGDVTLFLDFIMWAYAVIEGADVAVLSLSSKLNIY